MIDFFSVAILSSNGEALSKVADIPKAMTIKPMAIDFMATRIPADERFMIICPG
jgi:hypothetical protein